MSCCGKLNGWRMCVPRARDNRGGVRIQVHAELLGMGKLGRPAPLIELAIAAPVEAARPQARPAQLPAHFVAARDQLSANLQVALTFAAVHLHMTTEKPAKNSTHEGQTDSFHSGWDDDVA